MRSVFVASLRIHTRRYVAAAIAIIISVAFVVVIGVLISGARAGLMNADGAPYRGADYVIDAIENGSSRAPSCCPETLDPSAAIKLMERLGENASALGRVLLPARADSGMPLGSGDLRGETTVGPVAPGQELRWQKLISGRFPVRMGEAVVHVWDANRWEVAIGDRIRIGQGSSATVLEVVGLVESPSTWSQASLYVAWSQYLQWRDHPSFHIGSVAVRGDVGSLPEGMAAHPAEDYVTEALTKLNNNTDAFGLMLLLFSSVALFVSVLVVANTFSVLFAQRLREFALLRCIGATSGQVVSSVRREAATIGLLASLAGTLVGVGLGYGLIPLINTLAPSAPMGEPALPIIWLLGGFAIGIVATMAASWLPTQAVVRVSPLAALRPEAAVDIHTSAGRVQLGIAAALVASGAALLGLAMIRDSMVLLFGGGGSMFAGVLLSGPVLVPSIVRVAGALLGPAGRLAADNAVRNPQRTATTTAALMVGITLTTAVITGMATWRTAMDEHRDTRLPIDVALTSIEAPVSSRLLHQVRRTPGVEHAIAVEGTVARITGWDTPIPVISAPAAEQVARDGGAFAQLEPGTIRLDHDAFRSPHKRLSIQPGDRVTVRVGNRKAELRVVLLGGWGKAGIVSPATLAQLTEAPHPQVVWVRAAPGADWVQLVDDLDKVADGAGAVVEDHLQARAAGNRQLDILTWSVLGLFGISVAIALIGIGNTLGLSVLERAREHALLRALGLTRRQLRRMLAVEAVLLSMVATLLGTLIGVGFAWVGYETFVTKTLSDATMQLPWTQLVAVALIAAMSGLSASVVPARRAARVTPAAGLSLD